MLRPRFKRGFTLVETVVYLFILALISTVVITLLVNMLQAFYRFRAMERVAHSAEVALGRFSREVRRAISINSLGGSTLTLNTTDGSGNPTTITFSTANNVLMITEGAGAAATSTDVNVAVSSLIFRNISAMPPAVRMELGLTDGGMLQGRTFKFYDTAVLRGSY